MSQIIELITDYKIELQGMSNGNAPDKQGGMSTNMCTLWQRLIYKDYIGQWTRCREVSRIKIAKMWSLVEKEEDIEYVWSITTYDEFDENLKKLNGN